MGKKRKAGGGSKAEPKERNENTKMRITTYEDVADSEDEFFLNQDKILLDEGPQAKRLRKWKEEDKFLEPSDEEVLNYDDVEDDDEDDHEEEEYEEADEDMSEDDQPKKKKGEQVDEEELGGWGPSKKDYYNADAIETEQDALDEEAEALRLQKQQLARLGEDDYMLDDDWLAPVDGDEKTEGVDGEEGGQVVTEVLPRMQIREDMSEKERLKLVHTYYPEVEHLRNDFQRLQPIHEALSVAATATEKLQRATGAVTAPAVVTKYRACASYLGAIAMYFALLTSPAAKLDNGATTLPLEPSELHEHPVMETLLKCKQLWERVEHLPIAESPAEPLTHDELADLQEAASVIEVEASNAAAVTESPRKTAKKAKMSKAERAAEAAHAEAEARRAEKILQTEKELATLASLTDKTALRKAIKAQKTQVMILPTGDDSDIGDETELTAHELAEKAKKKKSLRFYTSQIAQKANKRGAAGRDQGGDMDIPHRERLKERQARLQAEAEKRGQKKSGPGEDLGADDGSDSDNAPQRGGDEEDSDGYYDMVASRNKAKKEAKQEVAAAYAAAQAEGGKVIEQEVIGPDGKRKISYMIEKNKGLTPHRKKDVRNPRVKKKLKYEKKKKALKSQKAVYSGGEGRGGYQGQTTGIKKNLVKSVKL